MRKFILFFQAIILVIPILLSAQLRTEKCGNDLVLQRNLERNPAILQQIEDIETFTQNFIAEHGSQAMVREEFTIPVVVHVLWNQAEENLSDLQIISQIGIINEDFQLRNENLGDIPEEFKELAANVGFNFCLASIDPDGNPTSGITRTETSFECIGDFASTFDLFGTPRLFYTALGGKDAWDPSEYLNIWVAPTCGFSLGYGFNPGQSGVAEEDGIVIDSPYFGNVCNDGRNHHLGRTTTHEIGHYFNLKHIWGKQGCATGDDFVADTPPQDTYNRGCPVYPVSSCGSNDMFMNFMDYTDDACISMFTHGQRLRMLAALMGPRSGLLESNGCNLIRTEPRDLSVTIFPNPTRDCIHVDFKANFDGMVTVSLFNAVGQLHFQTTNNASNIRSIDASELDNGIYLLHISNSVTEVTKRVGVYK